MTIPQDAILPVIKTARFVTNRDDQRSVAVDVVEGGGRQRQRCHSHRQVPHPGLAAGGLPAGTPVGVTFRYQEDGRLTVNARVRGLNRQGDVRNGTCIRAYG